MVESLVTGGDGEGDENDDGRVSIVRMIPVIMTTMRSNGCQFDDYGADDDNGDK